MSRHGIEVGNQKESEKYELSTPCSLRQARKLFSMRDILLMPAHGTILKRSMSTSGWKSSSTQVWGWLLRFYDLVRSILSNMPLCPDTTSKLEIRKKVKSMSCRLRAACIKHEGNSPIPLCGAIYKRTTSTNGSMTFSVLVRRFLCFHNILLPTPLLPWHGPFVSAHPAMRM